MLSKLNLDDLIRDGIIGVRSRFEEIGKVSPIGNSI